MLRQKSGFALLLALSLTASFATSSLAFAYTENEHWVPEQNVKNPDRKAIYGQVRFAIGAYDTVASVLGRPPTWLMKASGSGPWNDFSRGMALPDSNPEIKKLEQGFSALAAHFAKWRDDLAAGKGDDVDSRVNQAAAMLDAVKEQILALKPPAVSKPYSEAELKKINRDLDTAFTKLIQKIIGTTPKGAFPALEKKYSQFNAVPPAVYGNIVPGTTESGGYLVDDSAYPVSVTNGI